MCSFAFNTCPFVFMYSVVDLRVRERRFIRYGKKIKKVKIKIKERKQRTDPVIFTPFSRLSHPLTFV